MEPHEMQIDGTDVAINSSAMHLLGHAALWGVAQSWIPRDELQRVMDDTRMPMPDERGDFTNVVRAVQDLESRGRTAKESWDDSIDVLLEGDRVSYLFKKAPGGQFIVRREILRQRKDSEGNWDKPQLIPSNLARVTYTAATYRTVNRQKVLVSPVSVDVEHYRADHPTMTYNGLQALEEHIRERYREYTTHYTAEDIRAWLHDRFKACRAQSLKNAVTFIPVEYKDVITRVQTVLERLDTFRHRTNHHTECQLLPVQNSTREREWIAENVERGIANEFKRLLREVQVSLERNETSKRTGEKQSSRVVEVLDQFETAMGATDEIRKKYEAILGRRLRLTLDNADVDEDLPLTRYNVIASRLEHMGWEESVRDLFGEHVPSDQEIMAPVVHDPRVWETPAVEAAVAVEETAPAVVAEVEEVEVQVQDPGVTDSDVEVAEVVEEAAPAPAAVTVDGPHVVVITEEEFAAEIAAGEPVVETREPVDAPIMSRRRMIFEED